MVISEWTVALRAAKPFDNAVLHSPFTTHYSRLMNLLRRCAECGQPIGRKELFCPRCGAKQPREPKKIREGGRAKMRFPAVRSLDLPVLRSPDLPISRSHEQKIHLLPLSPPFTTSIRKGSVAGRSPRSSMRADSIASAASQARNSSAASSDSGPGP